MTTFQSHWPSARRTPRGKSSLTLFPRTASHEEYIYEPCARFIPIRRLRAAERRLASGESKVRDDFPVPSALRAQDPREKSSLTPFSPRFAYGNAMRIIDREIGEYSH